MRVAILGASDQPDRYAHKAFAMLREYKHTVFPVAPGLADVDGVKAYAKLADVPQPGPAFTFEFGQRRGRVRHVRPSPVEDALIEDRHDGWLVQIEPAAGDQFVARRPVAGLQTRQIEIPLSGIAAEFVPREQQFLCELIGQRLALARRQFIARQSQPVTDSPGERFP